MSQRVVNLLKRHSNLSKGRLAGLMNLPVEHQALGCELWDERGEKYLDCGGFGVFILGHRHPKVIEAVTAQMHTLPLSSRTLINATLADTSARLAQLCPDDLDYVFFTNSGAESTELALKLARANRCQRIIALEGSYHGKTLGALSVTHRNEFRSPFEPLFGDVVFVPRDDEYALEQAFQTAAGRAAFIFEPIQGEGGVFPISPSFARAAQELCHKHDGLLIADEIQSGLGRCGTFWAIDAYDVKPDIMLIGKGLSGGVVPCAAVVASEKAFAPINRDFLLHSSTFGGSPIALAAAYATLGVIQDEGIVTRAATLGDKIISALTRLSEGTPVQVRGKGLLIGLDTGNAALAGNLTLKLLQQKVITSHSLSNASTVRLTPSAYLTEAHLSHLFTACSHAFSAISNEERS